MQEELKFLRIFSAQKNLVAHGRSFSFLKRCSVDWRTTLYLSWIVNFTKKYLHIVNYYVFVTYKNVNKNVALRCGSDSTQHKLTCADSITNKNDDTEHWWKIFQESRDRIANHPFRQNPHLFSWMTLEGLIFCDILDIVSDFRPPPKIESLRYSGLPRDRIWCRRICSSQQRNFPRKAAKEAGHRSGNRRRKWVLLLLFKVYDTLDDLAHIFLLNYKWSQHGKATSK